MTEKNIRSIIELAKEYMDDPQVEQEILRAYDFAKKAHEGQSRLSGEPYIMHPVQATKHLMDFHPDMASIQACLLHDVPEDTSITMKDIEKNFGSDVRSLTDAMTKLGNIKYRGEERTIENLRKLFLAISRDLRVAFIKLCDRWHNMETLMHHPQPDKRIRIANETISIYAPIAGRLGIYKLKDILEDLCFQILFPEDHERITRELKQKKKVQEKFITTAIAQLSEVLSAAHINATVKGRIKTPYSIYKKMKQKRITSINDLYDIFALRVIVDDKTSCYTALGIIHGQFTPLPGRFKDYIAVPKANNYQSLHTTVIGLTKDLRDLPTEIQIRTIEMNQESEYGVAAHFLYKEHGDSVVKMSELNWIKNLEQLTNTADHIDFAESIKSDLFNDRIFVLTPKGDVKDLPVGSTPIDFAYTIHTAIGHHCKGAKVDGNIVPINYELKSGDVVEVITKKDGHPSQYWLSFVKTSGARTKIKSWFNEQNREHLIKQGKDLMNNQLERLGKLLLDLDLTILHHYDDRELSFEERESVLESIGNGSVPVVSIIKKIYPQSPTSKNTVPDINEETKKDSIIIAGEFGISHKLASCCSPKQGEKIVAFITRGRDVSIHRATCKVTKGLDKKRFVPAVWEGTPETSALQSRLFLHVHDTTGVLKDIFNIIYKQSINITDISVDRHPDKKDTHLVIDLDISDYEIFDNLIATLNVMDFTISVDGKILY